MTTFSKATITIATIYGDQQVQAMVRDGLAVHGSAGLYTVTHIASGKAVCHSDQQRTAKGVAIELQDWFRTWGDIPDIPKAGYLAEMRKMLEELKITAPAPKVKPIIAHALPLEPVYPTYFTPSETLMATDALVAAGEFSLVEDAHRLLEREMIMARMVVSKRAILTEDDIPIKGLVVYPLPPGIEPGYAGVKQLTSRLWVLGKEIDEQAREMVEFFNDYPDTERWFTQQFENWLAWERDFTAYVQQGWCDWAVCANLFSQLPKGEQEKVTKVLGFVGSDKQGWHAFGVKTFLRSKRLPELLRCRRAVKRALE